jgi:hypothetical protein
MNESMGLTLANTRINPMVPISFTATIQSKMELVENKKTTLVAQDGLP